jgi:hypothetical protein
VLRRAAGPARCLLAAAAVGCFSLTSTRLDSAVLAQSLRTEMHALFADEYTGGAAARRVAAMKDRVAALNTRLEALAAVRGAVTTDTEGVAAAGMCISAHIDQVAELLRQWGDIGGAQATMALAPDVVRVSAVTPLAPPPPPLPGGAAAAAADRGGAVVVRRATESFHEVASAAATGAPAGVAPLLTDGSGVASGSYVRIHGRQQQQQQQQQLSTKARVAERGEKARRPRAASLPVPASSVPQVDTENVMLLAAPRLGPPSSRGGTACGRGSAAASKPGAAAAGAACTAAAPGGAKRAAAHAAGAGADGGARGGDSGGSGSARSNVLAPRFG